MDIIGKKNWYFLLSGIVIIPGLISLLLYGLNLGIDFTGGSRLELSSRQKIDTRKVESIIEKNDTIVHNIRQEGEAVIIRTNTINQDEKQRIVSDVKKEYKDTQEENFETVGPVVGSETTTKAIIAVILASLMITLFIAWAFREVSKPVASWKFGLCVILTLLHDTLLIIGVFSLLGRFAGVEVDALFITAVLTIMGFSVHDTIVVFDRIRDNLRRSHNTTFHTIVNRSILETLNRSLNTSITIILVLTSLLLFGGESIRWFTLALLIGIISGTYSSIFNAAPLLVLFYEWQEKRNKK